MRLSLLLLIAGTAAPSMAFPQDLASWPQDIAVSPAAARKPPVQALALTPLPTVEASTPAQPPAVALPPPPPVQAAPQPVVAETPSTRPPVLVERPDDDGGLARTVGTTIGGVAGGAAGAAVAGPIGKFAGGFLGKRILKGLLSDKDDLPKVTAIPAAPAAAEAGRPANASATDESLHGPEPRSREPG